MRWAKTRTWPIPWLIAAFVLLGPASRAFAQTATFDPNAVVDLLPDGDRLGETSGTGTTEAYAGSGPCTDDANPDGYPRALIRSVRTSVSSVLRIDVSDDADGSPGLCRVAVYGGSDPFDAAVRADSLIEETDGCASGPDCSLEARLGADRTYLVVLWAASSGDGSAASVSWEASVKRPAAAIHGDLSGYRVRNRCNGDYEVIIGRTYTVTATTSETASVLTFELERYVSGSWTSVATYERPLESGRARLTLRASPAGRQRIRARIAATQERLAGVTTVGVHVVSPRWTRLAGGGMRLRAPRYSQQYRLTCEAAALRIAHNYHDPGSIGGDLQALRVIGIDARPRRGGRWGNPNRAFAGRYNGLMPRTGYGVHYGPVATAATKYDPCRPAIKLRLPSRQTIARHLENGYPVIVWGAHPGRGPVRRMGWRAWDGQRITAYSIEHVWVIVGYKGRADDPNAFIVHDPSGRKNWTVSISRWWAFTKYFRTGVVVRG